VGNITDFGCKAPANKESWIRGLNQERKRYADGYKWISEWVTVDGEIHKSGKWVKKKDISYLLAVDDLYQKFRFPSDSLPTKKKNVTNVTVVKKWGC